MKLYKHIIFDFDNTLWNFDKNSRESLLKVFTKNKFDEKFESFDKFFEIFETINTKLWEQYRKGLVTKYALGLHRFAKTLATVNINEDEFAVKLNNEYLANTTTKTELIPHTFEILHYLKDKNYPLHILTNGFFEVQFLKLRNSKLETYFQNMITSEEAGALKPSPKIYKFALEKIGALPEECLFIGDTYDIDIVGAQNVGIDQVHFNRNNTSVDDIAATHTIHSLLDLKNIL